VELTTFIRSQLDHKQSCLLNASPLFAGGIAALLLFSTDSHDDFKPQVKAQPASSVEEQIEKDVKSHDIFLFMKVWCVRSQVPVPVPAPIEYWLLPWWSMHA
jgi:hypothetical protein